MTRMTTSQMTELAIDCGYDSLTLEAMNYFVQERTGSNNEFVKFEVTDDNPDWNVRVWYGQNADWDFAYENGCVVEFFMTGMYCEPCNYTKRTDLGHKVQQEVEDVEVDTFGFGDYDDLNSTGTIIFKNGIKVAFDAQHFSREFLPLFQCVNDDDTFERFIEYTEDFGDLLEAKYKDEDYPEYDMLNEAGRKAYDSYYAEEMDELQLFFADRFIEDFKFEFVVDPLGGSCNMFINGIECDSLEESGFEILK